MTPTEPDEHEHVDPNEGDERAPNGGQGEHVEPNQPDEPDDHESEGADS